MEQSRITLNKQLFDIANTFTNGRNIDATIKKCVEYYENRQYSSETFFNSPRVSLNICKLAVDTKASKINDVKTYIQFTCSDSNYDCVAIQHFDEYVLKKLDSNKHDFYAVQNALKKGTEITYLLWNDALTTYQGIYRGGLLLEHIDPRRFKVANPRIKDLQAQKWVMFVKEEEIGALRELLEYKDKNDREEKLKMLKPNIDSNAYGIDVNENEMNHEVVTTYTRFFRVNGEVFFTISTENVDLFLYPKALNPRLNDSIGKKLQEELENYHKKIENSEYEESDIEYDFSKVHDYDIDYERTCVNLIKYHKMSDKEYLQEKEKFSLYPFAEYTPNVRDDMFYGDSEILQIQSVQRALNFVTNMQVNIAQNNAYNKIIAKAGAIKQPITNKPSEIIYDHTKGSGFGIKFAESQTIPSGLFELSNSLINNAKAIYGFGDLLAGNMSLGDISGYALQIATKSANTPIEQQQKIFFEYKKQLAEIRLMFYKFYVDVARYTYELEDYEVSENESARRELLARYNHNNNAMPLDEDMVKMLNTETSKTQVREFSGESLHGRAFDISVEVMTGLQNSELSESEMWNNLIMNGNLDKLPTEMLEIYMTCNPAVSPRTRNAIKTLVKKRRSDENYQLRMALKQLSDQYEMLIGENKELKTTTKYLQDYTKQLTNEFTDKINTQNRVIERLSPMQQSGASEGEVKSNNSRGINGTSFQ